MKELMCKIKPGHSAMTQPPEYASNAVKKPTEYSTSEFHFRAQIFDMI